MAQPWAREAEFRWAVECKGQAPNGCGQRSEVLRRRQAAHSLHDVSVLIKSGAVDRALSHLLRQGAAAQMQQEAKRKQGGGAGKPGSGGPQSGEGPGWRLQQSCVAAATVWHNTSHACVLSEMRPVQPPGATTTGPQCFKAVSALFDRQLRKAANSSERVNILLVAHKVLATAKKELRNKSRYREWCPGPSGGVFGMPGDGGHPTVGCARTFKRLVRARPCSPCRRSRTLWRVAARCPGGRRQGRGCWP